VPGLRMPRRGRDAMPVPGPGHSVPTCRVEPFGPGLVPGHQGQSGGRPRREVICRPAPVCNFRAEF